MARAADVPARPVGGDVATNDGLDNARVFVLILDALHVAPQRSGEVRRSARRFIEEHVGPGDLVAVVSPGGLSAATQDFTTDRARLLAAVDQFAGTKLRSATVEIAEEARSGAGALRARPGSDPSDHERAGRVQAFSSALEALARHLQRIQRRRKAVLLFSEGIDYNQLDVMRRVQMSASEVTRAMTRAVGALMRANVSLYAIDPRGLTSADGALVETQADGVASGTGALAGSVDQEFGDSIRSLRYVAESTGGFAAVNTNTFRGAFARIIEESSTYYVLGYSPVKPGKPGEFREIRVRVRRPDLRITARKGYVVPEAPPAADRGRSAFGSASATSFPRPGAAAAEVQLAAPDSARPAAELQAMLASPLPLGRLTLRLQAIAFRKDARKGEVHLVVEVLGRGLTFTERAGRFEERIELAMLTVDSRAKAANGRETALDLRLTREELERVRASGVRWLWRVDLPRGRHNVRVAGRAVRSGTVGVVATDVEVTGDDSASAAMSDVTIRSDTAVLMITRGQARPEELLPTPPSAARVFVAGDRIMATAELYLPSSIGRPVAEAHVEWPDGSRSPALSAAVARARRPASQTVAFSVDTTALPPGRYLLRILARLPGRDREPLERQVAFEIVAPAVPPVG
jgi:VWFA-related protein